MLAGKVLLGGPFLWKITYPVGYDTANSHCGGCGGGDSTVIANVDAVDRVMVVKKREGLEGKKCRLE